MWLPRGVDHALNVSLRFPTPLRVGDVLPVVGTHVPDRPFWGTFGMPPTAGISVDGTLTVRHESSTVACFE